MLTRKIQGLILLLGLACAARAGFAQPIEYGYVLLHNDRCLEGRVELVADRYIIERTEGNQVSIPRTQVQCVGESKKDLYLFKARTFSPYARVGDHFKLAKWCLSMQLLAEAGQHYLKVIQTHPAETNSSVKRLGVEIKDSMLQQSAFRSYLGLAPINHVSPGVGQVAELMNSSAVVAASGSDPFAAGQVPVQIKALFADQVQHILLNRCGQANCHGNAGSKPFTLQTALGADAGRRTEENIESVLGFINHAPSGRAAFLEFATRAHGRLNTPPIGPRESNLSEAIERWISFAENQVVTAEATSREDSTGLRPVLPGSAQYRPVPNPSELESSQASALKQFSGTFDRFGSQFPAGEELPSIDEIDKLDALVTSQTGFAPISSKEASSRVVHSAGSGQDPFDPAEFNRLRAASIDRGSMSEQVDKPN